MNLTIPNPEFQSQTDRKFPVIRQPLGLEERLLSAQEVAQRLGVSERFVRDHATRRFPKIQAIKLGSRLRFRWSDVQAFVAKLATDGPSKNR